MPPKRRKVYLEPFFDEERLPRSAEYRRSHADRSAPEECDGSPMSDAPTEDEHYASSTSSLNPPPSINPENAPSASCSSFYVPSEDDCEVYDLLNKESDYDPAGRASFPDSDFSADDIATLVMDFAVKSGLSWTQIESLMKFVGFILKRDDLPDTKFLFKNFAGISLNTLTFHYYCPDCMRLLGECEGDPKKRKDVHLTSSEVHWLARDHEQSSNQARCTSSSPTCVLERVCDMDSTNVDAVLDKLSSTHSIIFVFAFLRGLPATWNMMMPVFVAPSAINFRCADDLETASNWDSSLESQLRVNYSIGTTGNSTEECFRPVTIENGLQSNVTVLEPCTSWLYDHSIYGKTVTEEWNMVCGSRWMISLVQSIYLAGMVVGTVGSSQISDWFGCKWTMMGGLLLPVGASAMTAFSTTAAMYYASRFFLALGISGFADVIYTFTMETVSPRYRYMPTMTIGMGWTTGMLLLPWLHYLTREWRTTQLYTALTLAPLLALSCFLPESHRWLMATGRFQEAKKVVTKFAKNGRGSVDLVDEIVEEAKRRKAAAQDVHEASVADLFSTKSWAALTALFSFQQ
ncbi:hypothetical protein V5799_033607 [Amblyomma americanum]|uniref:Major facilitator superfamily (MFS) profile domain-containing protein n=1 Tax=Amblyomma americanum TaxID=6943 RepID=A0AAQ4DMU4_AMBAM